MQVHLAPRMECFPNPWGFIQRFRLGGSLWKVESALAGRQVCSRYVATTSKFKAPSWCSCGTLAAYCLSKCIDHRDQTDEFRVNSWLTFLRSQEGQRLIKENMIIVSAMCSAGARCERVQEWHHVLSHRRRVTPRKPDKQTDRQEVNRWLTTRFPSTSRFVPPRREQVGQARLAALLPWWGSRCVCVRAHACACLCVGVKRSTSRLQAT